MKYVYVVSKLSIWTNVLQRPQHTIIEVIKYFSSCEKAEAFLKTQDKFETSNFRINYGIRKEKVL